MPEETSPFQAELGFWSLTLLIMGSMIGSGIFFKPGSMLKEAGSVPLVLLAWLGGGLIAVSGGLMFAELGAAFPHAGGQSVFLREGLGKGASYLFSWTSFTVVQSGVMAAVGVALAQACDAVLRATLKVGLPGHATCLGTATDGGACIGSELPAWGISFVAVAIVAVLSLVNFLGVRHGARLNNVATLAKVAVLVLIVAIAVPARGAGNFTGPARSGGRPSAGSPWRCRRPCSPTTASPRRPSWPPKPRTPNAPCPAPSSSEAWP